MPTTRISPLIRPTEANFAAYGTFLKQPEREPDIVSPANHYWDEVAHFESTDYLLHPAYLKVFRRPFELASMERHVKSSQAFIPLNGNRGVFALALDDGSGKPDMGSLKCFLLDGSFGVNLHPGIWHQLLFAVEAEAHFILMVRENTKEDDMNIVELTEIGIEKVIIDTAILTP